MSIDVSEIKAGDTVTLEIRDAPGTYTITGPVWVVGPQRMVGPKLLMGSDRTVIDHKPVWREPEGWQEWDGLSIDGQRWVYCGRGDNAWRPIGEGWWAAELEMAQRMQGKTVTRLYITEQAPA